MLSDEMTNRIAAWASRFPVSMPVFQQLFTEAIDVVVFGSRAAGVNRPSSDIDILLVTPHKRRLRSYGLDLVLITPEEAEDSFWLGSELASHIVQFGKWIKGSGEWRNRVEISRRAIVKKEHRVGALLRNATQRWERLHPVFHRKYAITSRRELQRLDLLLKGAPIPPTATLDLSWESRQFTPDDLVAVADAFGHLPTLNSVAEFRNLIFARGHVRR